MMEFFLTFMHYFSEKNTMELLLFALIVGIVYLVFKLHFSKDNSFDLEDLICVRGKLDEKKFTRFGAWLISTWGFVYLMVKNADSVPEWYFMGYMGVWVTNVILDKYVNKNNQSSNVDPPPLQPPPKQ